MMKSILLAILLVCAGKLSAAVAVTITCNNASNTTYGIGSKLYFTLAFTGGTVDIGSNSQLKLAITNMGLPIYAKPITQAAGVSESIFFYTIVENDFSETLDYAGPDALENVTRYSGIIPSSSSLKNQKIRVDGIRPTFTIISSKQIGEKIECIIHPSEAVTGLTKDHFSTLPASGSITLGSSESDYKVTFTPVSQMTLSSAATLGASELVLTTSDDLTTALTIDDPVRIGSALYRISSFETQVGQPLKPKKITIKSISGSAPNGLLTAQAVGTSVFPSTGINLELTLTPNSTITDNGGNSPETDLITSGSIAYDSVPPIVRTLTSDVTSTDKDGVRVKYTAEFSESVKNIPDKFTLTNTDLNTQVEVVSDKKFNIIVRPTDLLLPVSLAINAGATTDEAGNSSLASEKSTSVTPVTLSITSVDAIDGTYKTGDTVDVKVHLNASVVVSGTDKTASITLETGSTKQKAYWITTTGATDILTFRYTVNAGDSATDLDYIAKTTTANPLSQGNLKFNGQSLSLTLPAAGTANSLSGKSEVVISAVGPKFTWPAHGNRTNQDNPTLILKAEFIGSLIDFTSTDIKAVNATASFNGTPTATDTTYTVALKPISRFKITDLATLNSTTIKIINSTGGTSLIPALSPIRIGTDIYVTSSDASIGSTSAATVKLTSGLTSTVTTSTPIFIDNDIPMRVSISAGAATDSVGNLSSAAEETVYYYDVIPPSCTVKPPVTGNANLVIFLAQFNEDVTENNPTSTSSVLLDKNTFAIINGTLDVPAFKQVDKRTWEIGIKPIDPKKSVKLSLGENSIKDLADNESLESNIAEYIPSNDPPKITITGTNSSVSPLTFSITSSKDITGLTADDFTIANGTVASGALTGTGSSYALLVTPASSLRLYADVKAGGSTLKIKSNRAITLEQGTPLKIGTETVFVDTESPIEVDTTPTGSNPFEDVKIKGILAADHSVEDSIWKSDGEIVTVTVANGAAQDDNGNSNTLVSKNVVYDPVKPYAIATTSGLNDSSITFNITFTEDLAFSESTPALEVSGLNLSGGTIDTILQDPENPRLWYAICISTNTNMVLSIKEDAVRDLANNFNNAAELKRFPETGEPVKVTLTSTSATTANISPMSVNVALEKLVNDLTLDDFTVSGAVKTSLTPPTGSSFDYTLKITPTSDITLSDAADAGTKVIRCIAKTPVNLLDGDILNVGGKSIQIASSSSTTINTVSTPIELAVSLPNALPAGSPIWTAEGQSIRVELPADRFTDNNGIKNSAAIPLSLIYDPTKPVFFISPERLLNSDGNAVFKITVSEQVDRPLDANLIINKGSLVSSELTNSNLIWQVIVKPSGSSSVDLGIRAGATLDNARNTSAETSPVTLVIIPKIDKVTSQNANGTYGAGTNLLINVRFSEIVNVVGTPTLELDLGTKQQAIYSSGSGTQDLQFSYTVAPGDQTSDLDYSDTASIVIPDGASIKDVDGNVAESKLAKPGDPGSLAANASIAINTSKPTDPGKPIPDGVSSGGGCGAGSGIGMLFGGGSLALIAGRRRRRVA